MSSINRNNILNKNDYIRQEENEKQYREQQIFLKNFNENFVKYKDKVKNKDINIIANSQHS